MSQIIDLKIFFLNLTINFDKKYLFIYIYIGKDQVLPLIRLTFNRPK